MAYWGSGCEQNDFAFGSVGAYIYLIKERMMKDIAGVLEEDFPEQSIVASLACLRLIGERFPKNLSVHFRKRDYAIVKKAFEDWYDKAKDKLPPEHRAGILEDARKEFALFENRILKPSS